MAKAPLISIITVNLNNLEGLKKTMQSVFEQTWQEFEYIIIDGGSTDGSKEYIQSHSDKIDHWVSEPDKGIYNGMNKGIRAANGEYLLFLNSGDSLFSPRILKRVSQDLSFNSEIYFGNVLRHLRNGTNYTKTYPDELNFSFFFDSALPHQATFFHQNLFSRIGLYDEKYRIAGDLAFLMKAICKFNISYKHLDYIISNFDMSGISNEPAGKLILEKERQICYNENFPLFYRDYKELFGLRRLNSSRLNLFSKSERNSHLRRINSLYLKVVNKILK